MGSPEGVEVVFEQAVQEVGIRQRQRMATRMSAGLICQPRLDLHYHMGSCKGSYSVHSYRSIVRRYQRHFPVKRRLRTHCSSSFECPY